MFDLLQENTIRAQATHLAELWHRLSTQHIALGCSCNMTGISVTLEDFERDIADYLWAESERLSETHVVTFLLSPGPVAEQHQPIRLILTRLQNEQAPPEVADWLLSRLTKTIESYAKLHGPSVEAPLLGGSRAWRSGYRD
jgi:hypothetical protein